MRGENFIYFSTASGFFIGVIFAIFKDLDFSYFLFSVFLITSIFYIISLAGVSFFIKFVELQKEEILNKYKLDEFLNYQIKEIEEKEKSILDSYEFIKQIEIEEAEFVKKNRHA